MASTVVELEGRMPSDSEYWKPTIKSEGAEESKLALPFTTTLTADTFSEPTVTEGARLVLTVTVHSAVMPPSSVLTVMVTLPGLTPVTRPFSTVAIVASLLIQDTFLLVALSGVTVAVSVSESSTFNSSVVLSKEIPVT